MSESEEEENYQFYGKLLEPYVEDEIPKKKAFTIEDQIATDDHGRRRFHGAFTGGFSAGFFNTVGSLEGWTPSEFKSSRSEKAEKMVQKPTDFMDDEDVGEFGIAPSVVRATKDYSNKVSSNKRVMTDGPIPGIPVLHALLQPAKDTVGIKLLKKMGWKPGQGVGPRLSKTEKRKLNRENKKNEAKIYGCDMPESFRKQIQPDVDSSSDDDTDITFAPDDYDPYIFKPKDNTFGMGYSGLDKRPILSSHINLFNPPEFKMQDHKNKKISISGQAFGVGAFENEDEDIYAGEDMTKYDFELDSKINKKKPPKDKNKASNKIIEGFVLGNVSILVKKSFPPPTLPKKFIPKHGARLSRFEPLPEMHKMHNYDRNKTKGRHDLTAEQRSKILNSEIVTKTTNNAIVSETVKVSEQKEKEILKEKATKITSNLLDATIGPFKPFMTNPDKQKRYEQYLTLKKLGQEDKLSDIQPISLTDWERNREKYEFDQAERMFKPVSGLVFDKFVSSSSSSEHVDVLQTVKKSIFEHGTQEMKEAVKKKMFGPLTRTIEIWVPHKLLCKRFNIPEPDVSEAEKTLSKRRKQKYNIFDHYEAQKTTNKVEGPEIKSQQSIELISESIKEKINEETDNTLKITELQEKCESLVTKINENSFVEEKLSKQNNKSIVSDTIISVELKDSSVATNIEENTSVNDNLQLNQTENESKNKTEQTKNSKELISNSTPLPTNPKDKLNFFKSIFLSSSEESDNEEEKVDTQITEKEKLEELKKMVLKEDFVKMPKPVEKKGIFADLDWNQVNKSKINNPVQNQPDPEKIEEVKEDPNIFGPKLPTEFVNQNISDWKPIFSKSFVNKSISSSSDDEWTEIDDSSNKNDKTNSKKRKKNKSEKKHKKHKSKHKKRKRSDKD